MWILWGLRFIIDERLPPIEDGFGLKKFCIMMVRDFLEDSKKNENRLS
jgi:hypothetical protein